MKVIVLGAVFVDIKGYPQGKYIPDGRNAGQVFTVHGGVARNIAEDVANLGLPTTFLSLVDRTGIGQDVLAWLENQGIDTSYIEKTDDGMGTWLAIFDENGDVAGSISKRPDLMRLDGILAERGDEIFDGASSVLLEFDLDRETVEHTLALAKKHNVRVYGAVSNMAIAMERRELMPRLSCFVCNLQEAGQLFNQNFENMDESALQSVLLENAGNMGIRRMVVTMGERGSVYLIPGKGISGFCPAEHVHTVDTTGAGDSFFAGLSSALTCGVCLPESCAFATHIAATVIGTTKNVCPRIPFSVLNSLPKEAPDAL